MQSCNQIIIKLEKFKRNKARLEHLDNAIKKLELELELELGEGKYEQVLKAYRLDGMPGNGYSFCSPVERWYEDLEAKGGLTEFAIEIKAELDPLLKERGELGFDVKYVESWLKVLNVKEKFIIEQQLISGRYWWEVAREFKTNFGYYISTGGMKNIKKRGLEKIYNVAGIA